MITVYYMNVKGGCSFVQAQKLDEVLLPERMEKIQRQKNASAANKQRLIAAFMQYCLSKELGVGMTELRFMYGLHGKPELLGQKLKFNMSHSGDYVVLAISNHTIGIDVEGKKKDRLHIAKRFFCEREYEEIVQRDSQDEKERCFLELWTMKEAAVKYLGTGLQTAFDSFLITKEKEHISTTLLLGEKQTWFSTFFLDDDKYCVSVCSDLQQDICSLDKAAFKNVTLSEIEDVVTNS